MKTFYIFRRIVLQIFNDKRSLVLIIFVPVFLFTFIYFLLGDSNYKAKIAQNGIMPKIFEKIEKEGVNVDTVHMEEGKSAVRDKKVDAFLYRDGNDIVVLFETNDAVKTNIVKKNIQNALKNLSTGVQIKTRFLYGRADDDLFNSLGYIMLGYISFLIIFLISGIAFVRERLNRTAERLMMTPVKRWQLVLGYISGFSFFGVIQNILLICFVKWVLNMTISGSVIAASCIMILLVPVAVCIGIFFSIFANNEFQTMQFIPIVIVPQIFFSGLIPLDILPYNLGLLSRIMPVYYACDALKSIAVRGTGLYRVLPDILALFAFIVLFFLLNVFSLKKYRRI